jgi:hypothetical protein
LRCSGGLVSAHGDSVSTSMVFRVRSKWYSRSIAPPPKYMFW